MMNIKLKTYTAENIKELGNCVCQKPLYLYWPIGFLDLGRIQILKRDVMRTRKLNVIVPMCLDGPTKW